MYTKGQKNRLIRRCILFLASQSITLFGSTLVQMAVVWYVTLSTSSGVWTAAFSICSYLPQFLISIPGGVWADRIPRKCLIISADLATAMITLAMIVLMPFLPDDPALLAGLLIMSVLRSLCAGIQTPAVNAAIPQLVPPDFLLRFNGINAGLQSMVQFAAPAAAGAVLSLGTLKTTLLIDIFTAIPGILLLSAVPLSEGSGSSCPFRNLRFLPSLPQEAEEQTEFFFHAENRGRLCILLSPCPQTSAPLRALCLPVRPGRLSLRAPGQPGLQRHVRLSDRCRACRICRNDSGRRAHGNLGRLFRPEEDTGGRARTVRGHRPRKPGKPPLDRVFQRLSPFFIRVSRSSDHVP